MKRPVGLLVFHGSAIRLRLREIHAFADALSCPAIPGRGRARLHRARPPQPGRGPSASLAESRLHVFWRRLFLFTTARHVNTDNPAQR